MLAQFRLAAATRCWPGWWRDNLREIASTGATGLQFDVRDELPPDQLTATGRRDFLHLLGESGLRAASTVFPLKRPLYDQHELERKLAALRAAMEFTFALKATVLCIRVGKLPDEQRPRDAALLREILDDLGRVANHTGVTLALSPAGDSAEALGQFVSAVTTGPLGIDFDPAYFAMSGYATVEALRSVHALVAHVNLRDGVRTLDGGGEESAVGEGAVDWIELLALLGEMEYAGWLTAQRTYGNNKPADIARALHVVKRTLLGG